MNIVMIWHISQSFIIIESRTVFLVNNIILYSQIIQQNGYSINGSWLSSAIKQCLFIARDGRLCQQLTLKQVAKTVVCVCHELCLFPHQFLFLKPSLHCIQRLQVFRAGLHHAVAFIIAYAVDVVGAGGEEGEVIVMFGRLRIKSAMTPRGVRIIINGED